MKAIALFAFGVALAPLVLGGDKVGPTTAHASRPCPSEMARVGRTCIDRYEAHAVDDKTGFVLSPYYPPEQTLLSTVYTFWSTEAGRSGNARARQLPLPPVPAHQRGDFRPRAVARAGILPQGYMTYFTAKRACENAGKRLCSEEEWVRACRGNRGTKHPYGSNFKLGACNVYRQIHPAYELHGNSSVGHLDPRLHLVMEGDGRPLLLETGQKPECVSNGNEGTVFDMEGNLDEWIDDPNGTFLGGFFSRQTREGCEAKIEGHGPAYTDYSIGTRCCKDGS